MSCAYPITGYVLASGGALHWSERAGFDYVGQQLVSCGQCAGCRRKRAAELTTRLVHEGRMHARSICATLTYDDEHLPAGGSLCRRDLELCFFRLRERCRRVHHLSVMCHGMAEYSPPPLRRPHYHVVLFGYWPLDAKPWARSGAGLPQWSSAELTAVWGRGLVTFEEFSDGAAAYCAEHQASKLTGLLSADLRGVEPEFEIRPRRPGLGFSFFVKHQRQLLARGSTVVGGREVPLPEYYLRIAERFDAARVSDLRAVFASEHWRLELARLNRGQALESSPGRLAAREACSLADIERRAHREFYRG